MDRKGHALEPTALDVCRASGGVRGRSVRDRLRLGPLNHRHDQRIVRVEHSEAVRRQALRQLCFRRRYGLHAAEAFQVRGPHVRHNTYLWPGDLAKRAYFARRIHAHLEHCPFVAMRHLEHRQRQPNLVVVVRLVLQHVVLRRQHRGCNLFRRRLTDAASYTDHLGAPAFAASRRQPLERRQRIAHNKGGGTRRKTFGEFCHQHAPSASLDRVRGESVTVDALAPQRDE